MSVKIVDSNKIAIKDATVSLYGASWSVYGNSSIDTIPDFTGQTDSLGKIIFQKNIFLEALTESNPYYPEPVDSLVRSPLFLITVVKESDSTAQWLPITEITKQWYDDSTKEFIKEIGL